jgi:flagellar basal-body rod modification protein FlgD
MVNPVGKGLDLASLGLSTPAAPARNDELGQEEFLSLMTTQLKNQDPFKPLESGEFLGQLAQFGTVSGLAGLKTAFDELAGSLVSNQALQAAALVGRSALVEGSNVLLEEGTAVINGAVELPESSNAVRIEIRDGTGQSVRELDLGAQGAGLARFSWDGLTDSGKRAEPGAYAVVAQVLHGNEAAAGSTLISAPVESVVFGAQGFTVHIRGLGELPFSAVREIRSE